MSDYYAEADDPGTYEKRWVLTEQWHKEAKAKGCSVTRTEIDGSKLTFKGWVHPASVVDEMDPFPAISPNRMYGDCLRYVYKDGRMVLQQKWIIPGETSLRAPNFEWRDVELVDHTEP